ncbi:MAG: hypothetical protein QOH36_1444 [Actinomycetota bacterium]|nr:hypothetical protein [Actinomycetota bacterium]
MTGRRSWATTAVALALGLSATAGCGGDDSPTETATTVGAPSTSAPSTTVTSKPATATTTAAAQAAFVDDVLTGGNEAERYTFQLTFPKLQGLADASVQDSINADVRAAVGVVVDEFVTGVKDFGAPPPPVADQKSALEGDYEVARLDDGLASVGVRVSRFYAGAAHPGAVLLTFNYDLVTGRRLALAELFAPGAPYLERLSELSRQLLLAQPGFDQVQDFVLPGTEPKAENFAGWTLTDQDLVITFSEYQVGPYAMGMPHVSIPFASLRTLLDPAGPLAIHN